MNLLIRVSFTAAATHKNFGRHILRIAVSSNVNTMVRRFATATGNLDCVTYNTLITHDLSRAVEFLDDQMRREKGFSPNETTFTSLIDSLCKQDRFDDAYRVLNQMILSGFSPSFATVNDVLLGFLRIGNSESEQLVEEMMMNRRSDDCVTYNTLIGDMSRAEELSHADELLDHMRRVKGLSPNKITFTSLIDSLCKQDRIDEAYKVLNEMFLSGFSPSNHTTVNDVLRGFLRIGDMRNAFEMRNEMYERIKYWSWIDKDAYSSLKQGFSDGVSYTSLMNAYLDEGKLDNAKDLLRKISCLCPLPYSVKYSVFINGLDNKARTTQTKKEILSYIYNLSRPTLEYHRTLVVNCSDDEFKSLVVLVQGFCNRGLENAYDTMLKWNYKPDGIVYNLFIIEHCKCYNAVQAYNMYKEMVHYGFPCHMFTVLALIQTLCMEHMVDGLRWVIQNVLRSCNHNDSEILKFLDEFNPNQPDSEALFNVLAEKAKGGLFLKCSYAPPSA